MSNTNTIGVFDEFTSTAKKNFALDFSSDIDLYIKLHQIINDLCDIDDEVFQSIYQIPTKQMFEWLATAFADICHNEFIDIRKEYDDIIRDKEIYKKHMDIIELQLDKVNNDIWSKFNIPNMYMFLKILKDFKFPNINNNNWNIATNNIQLNKHFNKILNYEINPSQLDLYTMYIFNAKNRFQISPLFENALYKFGVFCNNQIINDITDILLNILSHMATYERILNKDKDIYFTENNIIKTINNIIILGEQYGQI